MRAIQGIGSLVMLLISSSPCFAQHSDQKQTHQRFVMNVPHQITFGTNTTPTLGQSRNPSTNVTPATPTVNLETTSPLGMTAWIVVDSPIPVAIATDLQWTARHWSLQQTEQSPNRILYQLRSQRAGSAKLQLPGHHYSTPVTITTTLIPHQ